MLLLSRRTRLRSGLPFLLTYSMRGTPVALHEKIVEIHYTVLPL